MVRPRATLMARKRLRDSPEHDVKPQDLSVLEQIERSTKRRLTMQTSIEDNLAKAHPQNQSVLYSTIPKEVRDLIFAFATAQYEDLEHPYGVDERYYRPGYRAPHKTCPNLLLTCRRIWLETNALPLRQAVLTFWHNKGPVDPKKVKNYARRFTSLNEQNLTTVQLFLQLCEAEGMEGSEHQFFRFLHGLKPKKLRVTIRHSDWWDWEQYAPLELRRELWVQHMLDNSNKLGIRKVQLELETLESRKTQLAPIVARINRLQSTPRRLQPQDQEGDAGVCLKTESAPTNWQWTGSAGLKGNGVTKDSYTTPHNDLEKLDYHVEIITWNLVPTKMEPRNESLISKSVHQPSAMSRSERITNPILLHRNLRPRGNLRQVISQMPQSSPIPPVGAGMQAGQEESTKNAADQQQQEAEQVSADIESQRLRRQWEVQGSLIKFDE